MVETEGRIDYMAADPRFSGKAIGYAVCAGVTWRLLERGYKTAVLWTDDWRLPAIITYMKVGFEPVMYRETWNAAGRPSTPGCAPAGRHADRTSGVLDPAAGMVRGLALTDELGFVYESRSTDLTAPIAAVVPAGVCQIPTAPSTAIAVNSSARYSSEYL